MTCLSPCFANDQSATDNTPCSSTKDMAGCILVAVFVGWFLLTVLVQFPNPIGRFLSRHDGLLILPVWKYFAPDPVAVDYHLVFHYTASDGTEHEYNELFCGTQSRYISTWIWNPSRRIAKAEHVLLADLLAVSEQPLACLTTSLQYRIVVQYVRSQVPGTTVLVQFMITQSLGYMDGPEPAIVFRSDWYRPSIQCW